MIERRELKNFVRNTLGCACPDEVFERIEHRDGAAGKGSLPLPCVRVGGRLLIGLWETDDADRVKTELPEVLNAGRMERDRRGMNRFRLVIATDDPEKIRRVACGVFSSHSDGDDKIHLHVVSREEASCLGGS